MPAPAPAWIPALFDRLNVFGEWVWTPWLIVGIPFLYFPLKLQKRIVVATTTVLIAWAGALAVVDNEYIRRNIIYEFPFPIHDDDFANHAHLKHLDKYCGEGESLWDEIDFDRLADVLLEWVILSIMFRRASSSIIPWIALSEGLVRYATWCLYYDHWQHHSVVPCRGMKWVPKLADTALIASSVPVSWAVTWAAAKLDIIYSDPDYSSSEDDSDDSDENEGVDDDDPDDPDDGPKLQQTGEMRVRQRRRRLTSRRARPVARPADGDIAGSTRVKLGPTTVRWEGASIAVLWAAWRVLHAALAYEYNMPAHDHFHLESLSLAWTWTMYIMHRTGSKAWIHASYISTLVAVANIRHHGIVGAWCILQDPVPLALVGAWGGAFVFTWFIHTFDEPRPRNRQAAKELDEAAYLAERNLKAKLE